MKNASLHILLLLMFFLTVSFKAKGQLTINYEVYDEVFLWGCNYDNNIRGVFINILGISGGSGNYTVSPNNSIKVSKLTLTENEGFEVFVPLNTSTNNINFTITDTQNNASVSIDNQAKILLEYAANVAYTIECLAPSLCGIDNMVHESDKVIHSDIYQAKKTITSHAIIPDRNTSYIAGESITLQPGFTTIGLTNFIAKIGVASGCP